MFLFTPEVVCAECLVPAHGRVASARGPRVVASRTPPLVHETPRLAAHLPQPPEWGCFLLWPRDGWWDGLRGKCLLWEAFEVWTPGSLVAGGE